MDLCKQQKEAAFQQLSIVSGGPQTKKVIKTNAMEQERANSDHHNSHNSLVTWISANNIKKQRFNSYQLFLETID
jgi:hypothetical protein